MPVIPLECPSCGDELRINSDESAAICSSCGRPFVVKDAIVQNYIRLLGNAKSVSMQEPEYEEFVIEDGVLKRYNGTSTAVVIPDDVRIIGKKAFEDRREIMEVRFPGSVTEIEENAFAGCDNLQAVHFPDSLKKIGSYAFSECACLKTAALPYSVEEIGPYAFSGCFMLGSVRMPSSRSDVHETAFTGDKDMSFYWPDDWADKQIGKLKIAAPSQGGKFSLCGSVEEEGVSGVTLLFLGTSGPGSFVESNKFNFFTYKGFMRQFSLEANNGDPYLLRTSVDTAGQLYDAIADIQKSYSELIGLLDCADISRNLVEMINIPHFIWRQGKRLNDYKVVDIGTVPVLQIKLVQK